MMQCVPGLRRLPIGNCRIVGQGLKESLDFHSSQVLPAAVALVTLGELAYLVCIERALPILDTQFFERLKVARGPPGIWVEGGYTSARYYPGH